MPSATDRGLREYLARYRKEWEVAKTERGEAPYDWEKFEADARGAKHFALLSDAEWSAILAELHRAGVALNDEAAARQAINIETLASCHFLGFSASGMPTRLEKAAWIKQELQLAKKIEHLIPEILDYLGSEPDDAFDPHADLHQGFRSLSDVLQTLVEHIRVGAYNELGWLDHYPAPAPNAKSKPTLDRWGAGLVEVWSKVLNQPIENGVALQRFMVACASPYGWLASSTPETAERQARYFINRYLAGEVKTWRPRRFAEMWVNGMHRQAAQADK